MAHFAKLDENNTVIHVSVVDNQILLDENGEEKEELGIKFLSELYNHSNWKQTSYNKNFRKNYAGVGYAYDEKEDGFYPPQTFKSWILNKETYLWEPPFPKPNDGKKHQWNEEIENWEEIIFE